MNVYDTVNKLAQEIKTSNEYLDFKKWREQIKSNVEWENKIREFEKTRYEVQMASLQGTTPNKEQEEKMQKLYSELININEVKNYFDAEFKFNILLADVNKIIGESVKDVLE